MSEPENRPIPDKLVSDLLVDDPDMYDLVVEFVGGLGERIEELRTAHESLDWDNLSTLAHQLKGAGGSYGYADVSSLGATMEAAFKSHSSGEFEQWMKNFEMLIAAAHAGLKDAEPA